MPDLLTTDEAATYLRLSERKLYELVAKNAVPCTKVTGRWLFPRTALDRWVMAGLIMPAAFANVAAPPIVGGSHDPLLEWTLRESGCGLASLPEGSQEGLRRLTRGEVMIAAIHLHALCACRGQQTASKLKRLAEGFSVAQLAGSRPPERATPGPRTGRTPGAVPPRAPAPGGRTWSAPR